MRRLCVAAPPLWRDCKPCHALAEPSSPVFTYNASTMVDVNVDGMDGRKGDVYLQVAIANYVVMVIMQVSERVWRWESEGLGHM